MRKQLIIKIPEEATSKELQGILDMTTQSYTMGYPIYMFPGWEYEIVEVSEPMMVIGNNKIDKNEFIRKIRLNEVYQKI